MSDLYSGTNFNASKQTLLQSAQTLNFNPELIESFVTSLRELTQTFSTTPTEEQNQIFQQKLEAYKSSYTAAITSLDGLQNFFTDPAIVNDPLNQELFQIFTKLESDYRTLTASTAEALFTSSETANITARAVLLVKQASDRIVAAGTGKKWLCLKLRLHDG